MVALGKAARLLSEHHACPRRWTDCWRRWRDDEASHGYQDDSAPESKTAEELAEVSAYAPLVEDIFEACYGYQGESEPGPVLNASNRFTALSTWTLQP